MCLHICFWKTMLMKLYYKVFNFLFHWLHFAKHFHFQSLQYFQFHNKVKFHIFQIHFLQHEHIITFMRISLSIITHLLPLDCPIFNLKIINKLELKTQNEKRVFHFVSFNNLEYYKFYFIRSKFMYLKNVCLYIFMLGFV